MSFKYSLFSLPKREKYVNQTNNIVKNKTKNKRESFCALQCYKSHSAGPAGASGLTSCPSLFSAAERESANQNKWWLACSRLCFSKTNIHRLLPLTKVYDSLYLYKGSSIYANALPSCAFLHFPPIFAHAFTLYRTCLFVSLGFSLSVVS